MMLITLWSMIWIKKTTNKMIHLKVIQGFVSSQIEKFKKMSFIEKDIENLIQNLTRKNPEDVPEDKV